MDIHEVAKNFWQSRTKYPEYPYLLRRRLLDVTSVAPFVFGADSVLDLGCADGYMLLLLRELTTIKKFYGYDISSEFINLLKSKWGIYKELNTKVVNFIELPDLPRTDVTLALGSFPYIFDDGILCDVIAQINSNKLIVRTPCTIKKEYEVVNKFSEDLRDNYASVYRTVEGYTEILSDYYVINDVFRAYPDEIESKYGTKQFFFICKRKQ